MSAQTATVLCEGFHFLEGARWLRGELWFSDAPQGRVYRLRPEDGALAVVAHMPELKPSGLGFQPDGTPLVVTNADSQLRRIDPDGSAPVVTPLQHVAVQANDMWVDSRGRAYITQLGYEALHGAEAKSAPMVLVSPEGELSTAGQVWCPNGVALSPDERTLYTAETFEARVSAFDVDPATGRLSNQRVLAQFTDPEGKFVDGLCVDAENHVWVTAPLAHEVRRLSPRGEITDTVRTAHPEHIVVSCALGGPDLDILYMCTADATLEQMADNYRGVTARVERARVRTPGYAHSPA